MAMVDRVTSAASRRVFPWFVVIGALVAALSLRGPILAPTPVIGLISVAYDLDGASAGLVTTAPVLMFALMTPVAALVVTRAGAERAVLLTLLGIMTGSLVRAIDEFAWLLAGSMIIGASIMIGNIVLPVIIRRDVPAERVTTVTAAYTAVMNTGSLLTSLGTAPLASIMGWRWAVLSWTLLVLIAIGVWSMHMTRVRRATTVAQTPRPDLAGDAVTRTTVVGGTQTDSVAAITGPMPAVGKNPRLWHAIVRPTPLFLLAAFACQCGMYYATSTWLPTYTADTLAVDRTAAGAFAAIFQGVGIVGAFLVPLLNRWFRPIVAAAVMAGCWVMLMAGLAFAPELLFVWLVVGGIAQAGGFVVIFATLVGIAQSDAEAAGMSAVVQGGGYVVAAVAAPALGAVHDATGGWDAPFIVLLVAASIYTVSLLAAVLTARR